jgi:putative hemolysin
MSVDSSVGLLIVIALVVVNALLSATHAALVNIHKPHLRELAEGGNKRAQRVLDVSEDATRLLTSRQFVGIILRYGAAGILTLLVGRPLVHSVTDAGLSIDQAHLIVYPLLWLFGAVIMLLFGEVLPTAFASARPDGLAMLTVGPMTVLLKVLSPITHAIYWISNKLVSLFGGRESVPYVTEEEIKTLVDAGSEEGVIEDEEKEMIYSIFQFGDKVAREIMLPRIDIVALDADTSTQEALDLVLAEGHSRIPLYEGTVDKIIGLLYAKDLLVVWRDGQSKERKVREIMRPAYFVPESKKAGSLLEELQQRKIHMAIVIDEYGGTAGLITIEDLVEEIVGEIQDEYDPDEEADTEKISDDEYLFDGSIRLDDVNELLEVTLPDDENDTLAGYVFRVLDRVPLGGETFTAEGLEIKVEAVIGRRISKVRVKRLPSPKADSEVRSESQEQRPIETTSGNSKPNSDKPDAL